MTVKNVKSFLLILCAIACAVWSPGARAADGGALVYLDDEVNQCVADCLKGNPASSKDLEECRTKLSSCQSLNDAWRVSYAKLVKKCDNKFVAIDAPGDPKPRQPQTTKIIVDPLPPPPPTPPPPVKPIVICEGSAKKSADGSGCVCEDGVPARLMDDREGKGWKVAACVVPIEDFRKFVRETTERFEGICKPGMTDAERFTSVPSERHAELAALCDRTGDTIVEISIWYNDLVNGKYPLTAASWNKLVAMVEDHEKRLGEIEKRLKDLEKRVDDHEKRITGLENRPIGIFAGGLEWEFGAAGSYLHRAGYGTDTTSIGGSVALIGWVNDRNGVRVRVIAGLGANELSQRLKVGPEVAYLHAFDADKTVSLVLGPQATFEPNDKGNEASNVGGKIGINIRPSKNLFLEPELVLGGTNAVPYPNGIRKPDSPAREWGFFIQPGLAIGGQF